MKVIYKGIEFDSDLEISYYKHLENLGIKFMYQDKFKKVPIKVNVGRRKNYVPDFITFENNTITIIELKGWCKWNGNEDNNLMDFMKNKVAYDVEFLKNWLHQVGIDTTGKEIKYRRIKHLKALGFVDFDFKNPNTIANQRKEKIKVLEADKKASRNRLKDIDRYFGYLKKEKLTKPQKEWVNAFELENGLINLHRNYWRGI